MGATCQHMSISEIKQILEKINIQPDAIENKSASEAIFALLQLVERLNKDNEWLKTENQNLRDAINLLKGEQEKPTVLGKTKGKQSVSYSNSMVKLKNLNFRKK